MPSDGGTGIHTKLGKKTCDMVKLIIFEAFVPMAPAYARGRLVR